MWGFLEKILIFFGPGFGFIDRCDPLRLSPALRCIAHRKNAEQVVETWEQQFYRSSRGQRVPFLYLAYDILQNSQWEGLDFFGAFWTAPQRAPNDVIENGDDFRRKAAQRLVDIWQERKVFITCGRQTLQKEFLGTRNVSSVSSKLKQLMEDMFEKKIASYTHASTRCDEDSLFGQCETAVREVERVKKEIRKHDFKLGSIGKSGVATELQVQHGQLRDCIEKLKAVETSGTSLVSDFTEAVNNHVDIWDERKIFTRRGNTLRKVFFGRKNERGVTYKLEQPREDILEGTLSGKCSVGTVAEEPQVQHSLLRDGIENLSKAAETSGTTSVPDFREAVVDERGDHVEQIQNLFQVVQVYYKQVESLLMDQTPPLDEVPPSRLFDEGPQPPLDSYYFVAPLPLDTPPESPSGKYNATSFLA